MALGSHANPRDWSSLHCESHNQITLAWHRVQNHYVLHCKVVNWRSEHPMRKVHTDNYMVELPHVTTSTYAGETVTHSRDIFCRHKKIICGCNIAWDYDLKSISWTFSTMSGAFINWTWSPEDLRPTSKLEALALLTWLVLRSFVPHPSDEQANGHT